MIRFQIIKGEDDPIFSDWVDEPLRAGPVHTAVQQITELRKVHGQGAEISIERTTVIPESDRRQVRFKIDLGKDKLMYSKTFPIAEKDERLAEMKDKFPDGTVTEDVING